MRKATTKDQLDTMGKLHDLLAPFRPEERDRMVDWVKARLREECAPSPIAGRTGAVRVVNA